MYKKYKLKEIAEIVSGTTPKTNIPEYWNGDINWITPAELKEGHNWYIYQTERKVTSLAVEKSNLKLLLKGTVLLTTRAPIGKVALVGSEMCTNQGFKSLICNQSVVNSEYVYFWLLDKKQYLNNLGRGATFKEISKTILENIQIPLPSLYIQKKIVDLLKKAQSLIEKRKEQIALLDRFTQSLFLDMFGDPYMNPKNYSLIKLENLCLKILGGGTPSKKNPEYYKGSYCWVTPKDMKNKEIFDSIDHISAKAIENSSVKLIPENALLMVIRSGILKKRLPVAINRVPVTVNQDMKAFVIDQSKLTVEYLLYYFGFYQKALLHQVRSVTADNIDFKQIKKILVPLPSLKDQLHFSHVVNNIEQQKKTLQSSLTQLQNLFNSLMQRAFRGELFHDEMTQMEEDLAHAE